MPMSQETAARSSEHRNEAIVDPANYRKGVTLPSEAVQPTRSTTQPQQGPIPRTRLCTSC